MFTDNILATVRLLLKSDDRVMNETWNTCRCSLHILNSALLFKIILSVFIVAMAVISVVGLLGKLEK